MTLSIPQTIKPLLEGFDLAGRLLLFMWGTRILACCTLLGQLWLNCQNLAKGYVGNGNLRPLANSEKQLRQLPPAAIAGVLRVMYLNAASTMLFCGVRGASRSSGTVRRDSAFRLTTVGNWTARRR